jgi:uncharacterized membrane protein YeaQ/YmgE (transglycosylase-associated protein family)
MNIFSIIWSLVIGLIVGVIARMLLPGAQHLSLIMTALFGVAGSFVGGFVGGLIKKPEDGAKFHPAGMAMSVVGTMVLMFVAGMIIKK